MSLEPGIPEFHLNTGIALTKLGKLEEAIQEFKMAISLNPEYAKAFSNLAYNYLCLEEPDLAIKYAEKAISIYPHMSKAHSTLGRAFLLKNNLEKAESASMRALQLDSSLSGVIQGALVLATLGVHAWRKRWAQDREQKTDDR